MKTKKILFTAIFTLSMLITSHQVVLCQRVDSVSILRLEWNVGQFPENNFRYYSMSQADAWSNNLYDLGFWGVNSINNLFYKTKKKNSGKIWQVTTNYILGFTFSKYGSSLPIPLGEWQHEEYHRSVLGVENIASKNGMWLLHRWDGTVYGVSDEELARTKASGLSNLLYAYTAGIQAENNSTRRNVISDFHHPRKFYKNPLYLYNAWYVWNYFRFSTSAASDSVKDIAPRDENKDPRERDFAGSDLTAWIYDMFKPGEPFNNRDPFPGGEGVNRRIGFSDLPEEGQRYLQQQRKLSLLNFLNPAIFGINRIVTGPDFSFNALIQYTPTHFGNDISLLLPFQYRNNKFSLGLHRYSNYQASFPGLEFEYHEHKLTQSGNVYISAGLNAWQQPEKQGFFDKTGTWGGLLKVRADIKLFRHIRFYIATSVKTAGWASGNPYLASKAGVSTGFTYIY